MTHCPLTIPPEILLHSGRYFNILSPEGHAFDIEDVAHALAHLCRFGGHTTLFYSVAQHSVMASYLVSPVHAYEALMHDAAEAYIGDFPTPLKALLPEYKAIEKRVEDAVFAAFGLKVPLHPCVKQADLMMLAAEKRDLMHQAGGEWGILRGIDDAVVPPIVPWQPEEAKEIFLHRYVTLAEKRVAA